MADDEEPNVRLGKIEKYLLRHMILPSADFPILPYRLHARSCALQAYYREAQGLSGRQTKIVRKTISSSAQYKSLQVRFTRAMQRLVAKGLIEIHRVQPSRWLGDRGRGPEPAELRSDGFYVGTDEVNRLHTHVCCRRHRVLYQLTREGREIAHTKRVWRWKDSNRYAESA